MDMETIVRLIVGASALIMAGVGNVDHYASLLKGAYDKIAGNT